MGARVRALPVLCRPATLTCGALQGNRVVHVPLARPPWLKWGLDPFNAAMVQALMSPTAVSGQRVCVDGSTAAPGMG